MQPSIQQMVVMSTYLARLATNVVKTAYYSVMSNVAPLRLGYERYSTSPRPYSKNTTTLETLTRTYYGTT
jgi:hypothetical protein